MSLFVLEFFTNVAGTQADFLDAGFYNPYRQIPEYRPASPPTHYTTEGGGTYSARPDMTRPAGPGTYVVGGSVAGLVVVAYTSAVTIAAYEEVIEDETPDVQRSFWRSFSQALVGGFGVGTAINL
jgi:hypothetical protein